MCHAIPYISLLTVPCCPVQKPSVRERTPKEAPAKSQSQATTPGTPSSITAAAVTAAAAAAASSAAASPSTPGNVTPSTPHNRTPSRTPVRVLSPTPGADEDGGSGTTPLSARPTPTAPAEKSTGDITAEEYKAKLAEKRRQARERAEKEAEEERKRQEELE